MAERMKLSADKTRAEMAIRTNQMKEILKIRRTNPEKEKKLCIQMLYECENKYVEAFARTYLGDAYHTLGKIDHALPEYKRAAAIAEENNYDDLLSVLYNLIGIIYMYNDDEQGALDYFFQGIRLAEKLKDKMMHATLLANIAYVYRSAGAFDEAVRMLDESCQMIRKAQHNESNVELTELGYELDKIWTMLHKQEMEEAWELMQRKEIREDTSREKNMDYALYYAQKKEQDQCCRYLEAAFDDVLHEINQFEKILQLFELIEIALKAELYVKAESIADDAENLLNKIGTAGKWTKFMEYRIEIDKALGKYDILQNAYEIYYEFDQKYELEKKQAEAARVRRKMELFHELDRKKVIKQRQMDLYDRRGRDALTGLYNRWGMKNKIGELYRKYCGKEGTIAVAIVDVDFFKEYNDSYGHIAGDSCLKCIADILKKHSGKNGVIGRYGGDEFLVVLPESAQIDLERFISAVREDLFDENIKNQKSKVADSVTITVGGIVTGFTQDTDFIMCLHEADMALYEIKKSARNGYKVRNLV